MDESDLLPNGVPEIVPLWTNGPFVQILECRHAEVELGVALLDEPPHIRGLGIWMLP